MSHQPTFSTPEKSTPLSADADLDEGTITRESYPPQTTVPTEHLLAVNLNFPPGISPTKQLEVYDASAVTISPNPSDGRLWNSWLSANPEHIKRFIGLRDRILFDRIGDNTNIHEYAVSFWTKKFSNHERLLSEQYNVPFVFHILNNASISRVGIPDMFITIDNRVDPELIGEVVFTSSFSAAHEKIGRCFETTSSLRAAILIHIYDHWDRKAPLENGFAPYDVNDGKLVFYYYSRPTQPLYQPSYGISFGQNPLTVGEVIEAQCVTGVRQIHGYVEGAVNNPCVAPGNASFVITIPAADFFDVSEQNHSLEAIIHPGLLAAVNGNPDSLALHVDLFQFRRYILDYGVAAENRRRSMLGSS